MLSMQRPFLVLRYLLYVHFQLIYNCCYLPVFYYWFTWYKFPWVY